MKVRLLITSESELQRPQLMNEEEAIEEASITKRVIPFG